MHADSGGGAVAIKELAILCMNEHVHYEMKKLIEMQHKSRNSYDPNNTLYKQKDHLQKPIDDYRNDAYQKLKDKLTKEDHQLVKIMRAILRLTRDQNF